jgi:hypothetical protein
LFYSYENQSGNLEFSDNLTHEHGRHVLKLGAGVLLRNLNGYLTAGGGGLFFFDTTQEFLTDQVSEFDIAQIRSQPQSQAIPQYNREYRYNQYFAFAQDSFKVTPRLVLNYGLRYDNFGAPSNVGPIKDSLVQLGSGTSFPQRLANATLLPPPAGGDQQLYDSDNRDFSVRTGFAYSLRSDARTVLRGGYGIYYDPQFDNLWETVADNNVVLAAPIGCSSYMKTGCISGPIDFLQPVAAIAAGIPHLQASDNTTFPQPTFYQPGLRNGYAQNFFLGFQQQWTDHFSMEVNGLGSLDRDLLTTDVVNREFSLPPQERGTGNPLGYFNPNLQTPLSYRANQGFSDYDALTVVAKYHTSRSLLQASYTWSRVIDNQSDPLLGDFFDLNFTAGGAQASTSNVAAFRTQFDSNGNRGLADFDQRNNFVVFAVQELPPAFASTAVAPLFRNWKVSALAAARSGFPYSVLARSIPNPLASGGEPYNTLANVVDPSAVYTSAPATGGLHLLHPSAFVQPAPGQPGNTGRNAFEGPGLYSIDASIRRSFPMRRLGEAGKFVLRADAFNLLNHANLNNPDNFLCTCNPDFGIATFGRQGVQSGFPAVTPFNETPRQIQILLRLDF